MKPYSNKKITNQKPQCGNYTKFYNEQQIYTHPVGAQSANPYVYNKVWSKLGKNI